jgi:hypothetical protein
MRMKGKKPIFSYKDTWSLDSVLSPIIAEGLKKFLEVSNDPEKGQWFGVPGIFETEGLNLENDEDHLIAFQAWQDCIEEMIYAFENKEPNMNDYDFSYVKGSHHGEKSGPDDRWTRHHMVPDNKDEYDRYRNDETIHLRKVQKGYDLFGKYYSALWW